MSASDLCISLSNSFFFTQETAYELRISDWRTDVCSSDLALDCFALLAMTNRRLTPLLLPPAHVLALEQVHRYLDRADGEADLEEEEQQRHEQQQHREREGPRRRDAEVEAGEGLGEQQRDEQADDEAARDRGEARNVDEPHPPVGGAQFGDHPPMFLEIGRAHV